jgi:hypothetical protein
VSPAENLMNSAGILISIFAHWPELWPENEKGLRMLFRNPL